MKTFSSLRRFAVALVAISPRRVAETAVVMFGMSATEGVGLLLLIPLLQLVGVDAHQGALGRVVDILAAGFASVGLHPTLGSVLSVYLVVVGLQSMLQRREAVLSLALQQDVVTALRTRVYRAIAGARWIHFVRERASDYTQVLTGEVERAGLVTHLVVDLVVVGLTALLYVGVAFRVSPAMTALVLCAGGLLALTVRGKLEKSRRHGEAHSDSWSALYAAISEHLGSMKMAKSYGIEARHVAIFSKLSEDLSDVGLTSARSYARFRQQLTVGSAALLAFIVYASYTFFAVTTAQLLLLLFLFARLVPRLTSLYERAQTLARELPAFDAICEVERRCLAAAEPAVVEAHIDARGPGGYAAAQQLELEDVTFDYRAEGGTPALSGVSLTIAAGATTAIVGPSGAGKSTVADLLLGLLEPSAGRLLVDGQPATGGRLQALRQSIGYVPQETFLFHDTVRANLQWAKPDASEDEIWTALRLAAADVFVAGLADGLDTIVGDRGVLVSGGERQRLSLARALLRRPTLLILDEATSSLDSENEERIREAIDHLHQQMTIVIITHRLSTIQGADTIHVLDRGRLVESGTWHDLMSRRTGRFRDLCRAQGVDRLSAPLGPRRLEAVAR